MLLTFFFALSLTSSFGVEPDEILSDSELEKRAREISSELRCLVCRNENIDSSDADLAKDLRVLVRERLSLGESNNEVLGYVHARYGDFILLKPKFSGITIVLWLIANGLEIDKGEKCRLSEIGLRDESIRLLNETLDTDYDIRKKDDMDKVLKWFLEDYEDLETLEYDSKLMLV